MADASEICLLVELVQMQTGSYEYHQRETHQ